jgi:hypothetical protein
MNHKILYGGAAVGVVGVILLIRHNSAIAKAAADKQAADYSASQDPNTLLTNQSQLLGANLGVAQGYTDINPYGYGGYSSGVTAPQTVPNTPAGDDAIAALTTALKSINGTNASTTSEALANQLAITQETNKQQQNNNLFNLTSQYVDAHKNLSQFLVTPTSGGGYAIASGTSDTPGLLGAVVPQSGIGQYENSYWQNMAAITNAGLSAKQQTEKAKLTPIQSTVH